MGVLRKVLASALMMTQTAVAPAQPASAAELPKAPRDAAMTCYWAAAAGIVGAKGQTEVIAEATWYLVEFLHATKDPGDTLQQIQAMSSEEFDTVEVFAGDPAALAATCRQRKPRNSAAAVSLPADAFQRDTLCMAVTSLIVGFASSEQKDTGRNDLFEAASAQMDRIASRLSDERLAARGYTGDEAVTALLSSSLRMASVHGGLIGIYRACAATPA